MPGDSSYSLVRCKGANFTHADKISTKKEVTIETREVVRSRIGFYNHIMMDCDGGTYIKDELIQLSTHANSAVIVEICAGGMSSYSGGTASFLTFNLQLKCMQLHCINMQCTNSFPEYSPWGNHIMPSLALEE